MEILTFTVFCTEKSFGCFSAQPRIDFKTFTPAPRAD